ncbi:uncharacterized protein [Neodiprion pinetum]|uniref:uncharacterized protein n=1 Tax=Neodiprion pinetum TaxID=441929 RepID=UPI003723BB4D
MEEEILNIQTPVVFNESVAHYEIHAYKPYASSTLNNSNEIRITVQHQDLYILPSKNSVHIHGRLLKPDVEIGRSKNVGLISLMKGYASLHPGQTWLMENAGWLDVEEKKKSTDAESNFYALIPLRMILGFVKDYRMIVVNAKHESILTRSKTDVNAIMQTQEEEFEITINAVDRLIPYLKLADQKKVDLLNFIQRDPPILMSFRSWELYEYPLLPTISKRVWTLFLNSQSYPDGYLNLYMSRNLYALLYEMYANFQATYDDKNPEPLLTKSEFLRDVPLFVIHCSKLNESSEYRPVDIRLEIEAKANFSAETSAYCLILHDRIVEYNQLSLAQW